MCHAGKPGNFTVNLWKDGKKIKMLATTPDTDDKSGKIYEIKGVVPADVGWGKAVIQVCSKFLKKWEGKKKIWFFLFCSLNTIQIILN